MHVSWSWKCKWNLTEVSSHDEAISALKKNCLITLQHGPLSARGELQSHPLAGHAQACGRLTKGGWAAGPDGTYRDHWCFQRRKKKPFSRVIFVLRATLIFQYRSTEDPRIVRVILAPKPCNFRRIAKKKRSHANLSTDT